MIETRRTFSTSGTDGLPRRQALLLAFTDAALLYLAFSGALKARFGLWSFALYESHLVPVAIILVVYLVLLAAGGLYRKHPRALHLQDYLRAAAILAIASAVSITLMYLAIPTDMPPRGVSAIHGMLALVGILGLRAVLRQLDEWRHPGPPVPFSPTKPLRIEDVLPRTPVAVDRGALHDYLAGRTVLVTGAGGSIGAELARQILSLRPFRLVLVDVSEFGLFQLENDLRREAFQGELEFCIADVRDREMMSILFSRFQPDVVLHAAAYKHVPLMERHPTEAFRNNTLATVELLRLCEDFSVEQFVFVSTDKAVAPTSVLGATKRLAEWYVQAVPDVRCKIVRFGNVFGSQGSVVPLFQKQIEAGEAVGVTHPAMERYFMSADEACSLILQTLLLDTAPIFLLKMGPPISIEWLADRMIRLLRPAEEPRRLIQHTGIRPGEKLQEMLWEPYESPIPTAHESILGLRSTATHSRAELDVYLAYLQDLCLQYRPETLRKALFADDLRAIREELSH